MGGVIPTQDNLQMTDAGLIGKSASGVGLSGRMDAAAIRAFIGSLTQSQIEVLIAGAIAALVDSSPGTLDTLNELAAALGDDPNFAATVTNAIAAKYTKPGTGIPESDLSASVNASLDLADTALQSTDLASGTITPYVGDLDLSGGLGGGGGNSFATIAPQINGNAGTSVVADSSSDTLTINARIGCSIAGNSGSDTLTLNVFGVGSCPPAQISGAYRTAQMPTSSGQLALVANRLYKLPLVISERITIASCVIGVTALAAGSSIRIGIRRYDHTTGEFTTLPTGGDFGTVSSATTGTKTITGLSCTVDPGIYAIEIVSDGTPTVSGTGLGVAQPSILGAIWSSNFPFPIIAAFKAHTFGALPTDETGVAQTAVTTGVIPVVGLGV